MWSQVVESMTSVEKPMPACMLSSRIQVSGNPLTHSMSVLIDMCLRVEVLLCDWVSQAPPLPNANFAR